MLDVDWAKRYDTAVEVDMGEFEAIVTLLSKLTWYFDGMVMGDVAISYTILIKRGPKQVQVHLYLLITLFKWKGKSFVLSLLWRMVEK